MAPISPGHWASHSTICEALGVQRAARFQIKGGATVCFLECGPAKGGKLYPGTIEGVSSRCLLGSILPVPGCLEDDWNW